MSNRQPSWPGHYPITLYALEAISNKWSDNPATEIPLAERILYVACAFRAAVAMDTLSDFSTLLVLLMLTVLSMYKPRGMTRYGWRRQREQRAPPQPW